tara:strand:+ start:119 stop:859 length:741 start_codon:yes stop_codon:yes gene_type:complete
LKSKTGIFIGEALIANPDHPIEKLNFKNVNLEDDGLIRILEACNANKNIKKVTLGFVSSSGLKIMARTLKINKTLEKLKFQEHKELRWEEDSKKVFIDLLKTDTNIVKVKFEPADKKDATEGHKMFKKECEMFVKKIKKEHKAENDRNDRIESCSNENMFNNLLELIENKDDHEKMPVRKFFNNTFGTLLNDAIFALMKKQEKSKSNTVFTMQGSIKFVAQYLQDHMPESEAAGDSEEEEDETDQA